MIPQYCLTEWRQKAPWTEDYQVEQDLIISRVLVEIFNQPTIADSLAFRGGTALYKLFTPHPVRYSEDIDLVQINKGKIGDILDAIRRIIDPFLGKPARDASNRIVTLTYKIPIENSIKPQKLKIEINSREHFSVYDLCQKELSIESAWFSGKTAIKCYHFDELIGTKLRALYQRRKGRDLFDIWFALQQDHFNPNNAVQAFQRYMEFENKKIGRGVFEKNLADKVESGYFTQDINPLLAPDIHWNALKAAEEVYSKIISLLPD